MTVFDEKKKIAVIAGAGPAGLTAALELLRRSDITPIVFEADDPGGRNLQDHQLPRQSNGSRRPPVLFEIGLGHALVAGDLAGGRRTDARDRARCASITKANRGI